MHARRRPAVIHLIEENLARRPFHLNNVELSAARLVGNRMAGIVLASAKKASRQSGLTTNSGTTTNVADFPGWDMVSVLPWSRRLDGRRGSGPFHFAPQINDIEVAVQFDIIDGHYGILRHGSLQLDVVCEADR